MSLNVRSDLENLFVANKPLLDLRAPVEFARGAFPGAVNLPLLEDDERAAVGTAYTERGPDEAVALGHRLVAGLVRDSRVERWVQFAKLNPDATLYCFRGGMRSSIAQGWLADAGIEMPRVDGGYKRMRGWLIERTSSLMDDIGLVVLGGQTGTGKTRIIHELDASVDLEGLANHRGSAFGRWPDSQPTQIDFENALAIRLLRLWHSGYTSVVVEDEGGNVGGVSVPKPVANFASESPLVVLEATVEQRVDETVRGYIRETLDAFRQRDGDDAFEAFSSTLLESLGRIRKRLGGDRYRQLETLMRDALITHQRDDDPEAHRGWIRSLLIDYYDPMYDYQLAAKEDLIVFRGEYDAVRQWLDARTRR